MTGLQSSQTVSFMFVVTCPSCSGHWFALESVWMSSSNPVSKMSLIAVVLTVFRGLAITTSPLTHRGGSKLLQTEISTSGAEEIELRRCAHLASFWVRLRKVSAALSEMVRHVYLEMDAV